MLAGFAEPSNQFNQVIITKKTGYFNQYACIFVIIFQFYKGNIKINKEIINYLIMPDCKLI